MLRKIGFFLGLIILVSCSSRTNDKNNSKDQFLKDLKQKTFNFFWETVDKPTGQIPDRYPKKTFTSIAATGFGLPSYIVGIENNYISRKQGAKRVLKTLEWLWDAEQGPGNTGISGYKGFFYHFLTYGKGNRYKNVELSTIDTGLLMAGILVSQSYFDKNNHTESQIRALADSLYRRVEWDWAMDGDQNMSMGWRPESGFIEAEWKGYNEAMILIIMAMGSPTHPIGDSAWDHWCETYQWDSFYGYDHVNFSPLFGHQYSHIFIDFKGIQDSYMREKGFDYFENSKRATLANRAYCIDNPSNFGGYSEDIWGLTACDGPSNEKKVIKNDTIQFFNYRARGASARRITDDGTIAPTAAGGSIPFTPEKSIDALYTMKERLGSKIYGEYGFKDAFNLTYKKNSEQGWFDDEYLGIDQGPIILQIENYQTGLIWDIMKKNPYIIKGLRKAGFKGGWLEKTTQNNDT